MHKSTPFTPGLEYIVDAYGCNETALQTKGPLQQLLSKIIQDLRLGVIGEPVWHAFPEPGGFTALVMLTESHLSLHTFPESGYAALNLYCCRQRAEWDWQTGLQNMLGATEVTVRTLVRGRASAPEMSLTEGDTKRQLVELIDC